jgi:hypothetical protein
MFAVKEFGNPTRKSARDTSTRDGIGGRFAMGEVHQLQTARPAFGLLAAGRLMTEVFAPWVQDLALLVESVEATRPAGAQPDWRLPIPPW